jgi:hypothetical protein
MTISENTSVGAHFGEGEITGMTLAFVPDWVLLTLDIPLGAKVVFIEVKNTGSTNVFDQFDIQRRVNKSGDWSTIATSAGDYSTPLSPLLEVQGAPVTLAAGKTAFIRMDVECTDAIQILASADTSGVFVDIHYRIQ